MTPWDAGGGVPADPFEGAAQSGWLDDEDESGEHDAGAIATEGGAPGDAGILNRDGSRDATGVD